MNANTINPPSIERISNAIEVLGKLKDSRLAMMPMIRKNRPIQTVRIAESELKALEYIQDTIGNIKYLSFYRSLDNAINKAIETEASHLSVNILLGENIDYSKTNFFQIKIAR